MRLPPQQINTPGLKVEAQCELQLPHVCSTFESGDLPIVTARAINARVGTVVGAEGINGMIENVEGIHTELSGDPLCDRDFLGHR